MEIVKKLQSAVEKYRDMILDAERFIWCHPETGYREWETSAYLEKKFEDLGYTLTRAENIPGFYTRIDTGREGPEVLILGEMDSVLCPSHPEAEPTKGAVHACGHHIQSATLLGIAAALTEPHILDGLCGKIRLCAVPAEELLEIEYRRTLKEKGIIKYFGGKLEFISRGYFDGVDIAFMVHPGWDYYVQQGSVGCLAKNIIYKGQAAHAGGAPWNGVNALYAANCGMNAANALRETFSDSDLVRFHPIITKGGSIVNAIPEEVRMESYVRGKTYDAICKNNQKINQALTGAALSLNANVEIVDIPGYSPLNNAPAMIELSREAAEMAIPQHSYEIRDNYSTGSTDMGDLSMIMPTVQPYAGGVRGTFHGNTFEVVDPVVACVDNAKWQLTMLYLLLTDGAARAKEILSEFKPQFASKEEFLSFMDALNSEGDRIEYLEDGTAKVRIN